MAAALEASRLSAQQQNGVVDMPDVDSTSSNTPEEESKADGGQPVASSTGESVEIFADALRMEKYKCLHGFLDPKKTQYLKVFLAVLAAVIGVHWE